MDVDFPCKKCGHGYLVHTAGLRCDTCFYNTADQGPFLCYRFEGDNLKYLELKQDEDN